MGRAALDAFIEESTIFRLVDELGRDRLAAVAEEIDFAPGTVIFREGDLGDSFYCTVNGTVKVTARDPSQQEKDVATLTGGSVFGEIAALAGGPRTATLTAQTHVKTLRFEIVAVFEVLKDYPEVLAELRRLGIHRTEDLLTKVMEE